MHLWEVIIGTHVFVRNGPANIFQASNLSVLTELNTCEITRIACVDIATRVFPSSLNQVVSYVRMS